MSLYRVAVVGATGAVGTRMRNLLRERNFPFAEIVPFASERSAGKVLEDGLTVVGLVDLDRTVAETLSREFNLHGVAISTNLDAVLSETKPDILFDIVVPEARRTVVATGLAHGCHVLSEKPMAVSLVEARELRELAEIAGKLHAVVQNRRYIAGIRRIRRMIEDGVLVDDTPQGEGQKIELKTAIDDAVPQLISVADGSAYFDGGTVTLAKGETVVISIAATSAGPTCEWVLEADYVDHGERESLTIKAPGDRPFAVTGHRDDRPYSLIWSLRCLGRAQTPEDASVTDEPRGC